MNRRRSTARARARCLFRVAAGPRVGFGHLMRARALAGCLDMDVALSVRGGRAAREAARAIGPLADATLPLADHDVVIVDDPSEKHGRSWIARARRQGVPTVSVHDDGWAHDADLVVCASLGIGRPQTQAPMLNGAQFYLLDRRIADTRRTRSAVKLSRPRVLIALGGGEHVRRIAQRIVDAIVRRVPAALVSVAAGFASGRRPALKGARWLSAKNGLVRALDRADVAIVAGGVTLYEACALGVPAVGLSVVRAQQRAIRAFAREGAVINAGDAFANRRAIENAAAAVARLVGNLTLRRTTSARACRLVDGRGAARVAAHIAALIQGGVPAHV